MYTEKLFLIFKMTNLELDPMRKKFSPRAETLILQKNGAIHQKEKSRGKNSRKV